MTARRPGRPVSPRTAETFARDIAHLRRLRAAVLLDDGLTGDRAAALLDAIEDCIAAITAVAELKAA